MADVVVSNLRVDIELGKDESGKIQQVSEDLATALEKVDRANNKATNSIMKTVGKVTTLAYSFKKVYDLTKTGILGMEQMARATNVLDNVLGDASKGVIEYAKVVEDMMGIPMNEFLGIQSTFATMFRGFDIGVQDAVKMSQAMTQLSYDLEAWNGLGIKQEQILSMLQSGISGYDRSLRKLGYVINDAELQQTAYNHGLDINVSKLNRSAKAQLAYMSIMEQSATSGVMGALSRQTESPTIAFGILKNQTKLLAQTLAGVLIPVIMKVLPYLTALAMAVSNIIVKIAGFFGIKIKPLDFGIGKSTSLQLDDTSMGLDNIGNSAKGANKKIKELKNQLGGFDKLNVMKQETPQSPAGGGAGVPDIGGGGLGIDMPEYGDFLGDMMGDINELVPKMETLLGILGAIGTAMAIFKFGKLIAGIPFVASLVGWFSKMYQELGFIGTVGEVVSKILGGIFSPAGLIILGVIAVGLAIKQLWEESESFRTAVIDTWNSIGEVISSAWNSIIKPILDIFGAQLTILWTYAIKPLWDQFVGLVGAVGELFMSIWNNALAPLLTFLMDTFGPAISVVVGLVSGMFLSLLGVVMKVAEGFMWIIEKAVNFVQFAFELLIGFVVGVFTGEWNEAWQGIFDFFDNIGNWISEKVTWVKDKFFEFIGWIANGLLNIWNATFGKVIETIVNFGTKVWEQIDMVMRFFGDMITFLKVTFTAGWRDSIQGVVNIFSTVFGSIFNIAKNIWDKILGLFAKGGQIFTGVVDGIARVFTNIVNTIISGMNKVIAMPFNAINKTLNSVRAISILGMKPFQGLWGYNPISVPQIPKFPAYEKGTNFVPETGMALLHKGEEVVPRSVAQGKQYQKEKESNANKEMLQQMIDLLKILVTKDTDVTITAFDLEQARAQLGRLEAKVKGV